MGFPVGRFSGDVDEEVICTICHDVLEDPVQTPCEHAFCTDCIDRWIAKDPSCPVDRQSVTQWQLKPPSRLLKSLLSRLEMACEFSTSGCLATVRLESITSHVSTCPHNPNLPLTCTAGCSLSVLRKDLSSHDCVRELRAILDSQSELVVKLREDNDRQGKQISELSSENARMRREMSGRFMGASQIEPSHTQSYAQACARPPTTDEAEDDEDEEYDYEEEEEDGHSHAHSLAAGVQCGVVKWYNTAKSYGFVSPCGGGPDVFVHQSAIKPDDGCKMLSVGEAVEFFPVVDEIRNKVKCLWVTGPNGGPLSFDHPDQPDHPDNESDTTCPGCEFCSVEGPEEGHEWNS